MFSSLRHNVALSQVRRFLSTSRGIILRSSGVIFDPYPVIMKDNVPSLFSYDGVMNRINNSKSVMKSSYSAAFIQKHFPSYSARLFAKQAEGIFEKFINEHRNGSINNLRSILTENMIDGIRKEFQKHENDSKEFQKGKLNNMTNKKKSKKPIKNSSMSSQQQQMKPVLRKAFMIDSFALPPSVLQMRHGFVGDNKRSSNNGYAQVTVLINSIRKLVQVDLSGNVIENDDDDDESIKIKTPSVVVFEVGFGDPNCNWRIARIEEVDQGKKEIDSRD